ncbi:MAG: hypothetical protein EBS30_19900, partial [Planctomycetes bacterium]|nr:hypothetical protein [Planctomycetota bacterium]
MTWENNCWDSGTGVEARRRPSNFLNGIYGSFQFTATGNPAPTFSVTTGTLPAGLTLSPNGLLSGITTTVGTTTLTVTATNGVGTAVTQSFSITVNPAPVFSSPATAAFTNTVAGSFTPAATGSPTYSIEQQTFFASDFTTFPRDWLLTGNASLSGGSCVLNDAIKNQQGALFLPKLGASSPGSFTASFDFSSPTNTSNGTGGTSFNYGVVPPNKAGNATSMTTGLAVAFLDSLPSGKIEVRWQNTVIGSALITYASTAKPVEIKLDGANILTVSYDGAEKLRINLAGKVNAAERSNYQFV